ncbi:MAG: hypothetical protein OXG83_16895 [Acidobacteria bacterium]|nr:hypothetical protein [Acidobacteriota bacterium]
MKLVKHITIALVLCAIPAMAFGQSVTCDDCTHVVSVYKGHGGLIAMAAEDAEMVTWVATCEGVTRSDELMPNDAGMVSMLLMDDTACYGDDEDNSFEIGPIMDGGWYWITDATNSAVGGLVNKDILMNETTMLADAGEGVTMTMGKGAVLLKETATGRVGLLPNILPVEHMDAPPANPCGASGGGTATNPFVRKASGCSMGDGGTITLANYFSAHTGATTRVMSGDSVTRPATDQATTTITIDLWGNGTGAIFSGTDGGTNGINWVRGNAALSGATTRAAARYVGVTYTARKGSGPDAATLTSGTADGGVTFTDAGDSSATVAVTADSAYCSSSNNHSQTISVSAVVVGDDATGAAQVIPSIAKNATTNVAGGISFTIVCPSASATMGQELVPENPFPTE